jgi:hypothetical protein
VAVIRVLPMMDRTVVNSYWQLAAYNNASGRTVRITFPIDTWKMCAYYESATCFVCTV